MRPEEMTKIILDALRRPSYGRPCQLTLVDGRQLDVILAGIECFGELRSLEVIEATTGNKSLIPYRDIAGLSPG